jgi:hypothetical protein
VLAHLVFSFARSTSIQEERTNGSSFVKGLHIGDEAAIAKGSFTFNFATFLGPAVEIDIEETIRCSGSPPNLTVGPATAEGADSEIAIGNGPLLVEIALKSIIKNSLVQGLARLNLAQGDADCCDDEGGDRSADRRL